MTAMPSLGEVSRSIETRRKASEFVDVARCLMLAESQGGAPERHAAAEGMSRSVTDVLKTNVAGTIEFLPDTEPMGAAFLATLANSAFDIVLTDSNVVPLGSRFGVMTARPAGAVVARGAAKPVSAGSVVGAPLTERKAASLIVASDETLRFGVAANALLGNALRQAVASAVDVEFIAGLIAATTPVPASGLTASDALHDIRLALDAIDVDATSRLHLIVGADVVKRLAVMATTGGDLAFPQMTVAGGSIGGIRVSVSDAASDNVVLVDARALAMASDAIRLRASQQATLEMENTAPSMSIATGSPEAPAESNVVSMFQTNSTALLAERFFGFSVVRASGVASLSGVQWGLVGSPPA